jgi:hypothetical protein
MGRLSLLLPFDTNKRQSACCCTAVADIAFAVVIYMSCVPQTESIFALIPTKDFVIIYNKLNLALAAYNFYCSTYCVELILHLLEDKIFTATYSIVCLINSR